MKSIDIKGVVMKLAATGGGAVAAASLNKISFMQTQQPLVRGAIKVALGAFGPKFLSKGGKTKSVIDAFGDGLIAVGALELANASIFKSNPVSISGFLPVMGNMYPVNEAAGY